MSDVGATEADDFEDLFESAPCGYLSLSPDGIVVRANRRIAGWMGCSVEDLSGRRIQDLLGVAGRIFWETNVSPLLRIQGSVDEVAMTFRTADGAALPCLVNAAERRDEAGQLLFTRLAIFNAVERRRYERSLVGTNRAAEVKAAADRETAQLREQFIAVLGHDLRNPLASISSGIRLLTRRETLSLRGEQILALMQGSVVRASELIDNVLDFARGRLGGGITLNRDADSPLSPVLEQVIAEIASIAPQHDIRSVLAIAEPVDCDRTRIGQLLSNLLGNAVTHGTTEQPIRVRAETSGDAFALSVANAGPPIPEAAIGRLFQPFFRGNVRPSQVGLGLGLHIAYEIAKAHDGDLQVSSTASETRFTFTMPLREASIAID